MEWDGRHDLPLTQRLPAHIWYSMLSWLKDGSLYVIGLRLPMWQEPQKGGRFNTIGVDILPVLGG